MKTSFAIYEIRKLGDNFTVHGLLLEGEIRIGTHISGVSAQFTTLSDIDLQKSINIASTNIKVTKILCYRKEIEVLTPGVSGTLFLEGDPKAIVPNWVIYSH